MMTLLKRDKINYKILITDDDDDCRYGLNETPPLVVLVGGTIVLSAVFLQFFKRKIEK